MCLGRGDYERFGLLPVRLVLEVNAIRPGEKLCQVIDVKPLTHRTFYVVSIVKDENYARTWQVVEVVCE